MDDSTKADVRLVGRASKNRIDAAKFAELSLRSPAEHQYRTAQDRRAEGKPKFRKDRRLAALRSLRQLVLLFAAGR